VLSVGIGAGGGSQVLTFRSRRGDMSLLAKRDPVIVKSASPVYALSYEGIVTHKFSVGIAASYQSFYVKDPSYGSFLVTGGDIYNRYNFAIRGLLLRYYQPRLEGYFGFRAGLTIWKFISENKMPEHLFNHAISNGLWGQLIWGVRYFPGHIGFGAEIGLGTAPYMGLLSVCYHFGRL
jgi:hypothetical protein